MAVFFLLGAVAAFDPRAHLLVLVGAIVIDDQMQDEPLWGLFVDHFEKGQPFLVCVPGRGVVQDFSVQVVQRRKEGNCSVARVIMRGGSHLPNAKRQTRLRSLKGLALTFFVATQHQCFFGRIQIEANDIPEFLLEPAIVGNFKGAREVRLDIVGLPNLVDGLIADSLGFGHGARRPALATFRRAGCFVKDFGAELRADRGLSPATLGFLKTCQSIRAKAPFPFNDHRAAYANTLAALLLA